MNMSQPVPLQIFENKKSKKNNNNFELNFDMCLSSVLIAEKIILENIPGNFNSFNSYRIFKR